MTGRLTRLGAAAALTLVLVAFPGGMARGEHDAASPAQARTERLIHDYLLDHPDVVVEAINTLRAREEAAKAERTRAGLAAHRDALFNDPDSPVAGNPDGDVTLVEFFDYQCAYCKRVLKEVMAVLAEDSGLRVVYKEYPILGPASVVAARAALASRKQDPEKYLRLHNALMSARGKLTDSKIMRIAGDIGFDVQRLKADMALPDVTEAIERNRALARALGIKGTPSFVIGDQLIPGAVSLDALRKLIAQDRSS